MFFCVANLCMFFYHLFTYMYCRWRSNYQKRSVVIPFTGLAHPHFCFCSKPGPGFPMSYVMVFCVFSESRWEVSIVCSVEMFILVEICLKFLFINLTMYFRVSISRKACRWLYFASLHSLYKAEVFRKYI